MRLFLLLLLSGAAAAAETGPERLEDLTPQGRLEYLAKYLTIGEGFEVKISGNVASVSPTYSVYQGQYRRLIGEDDFYRMVGRDDLATAWEGRRTARIALRVAAVLSVAAGFALAFSQTGCNLQPGDPRFADECVHGHGSFGYAVAGLAGGAVLWGATLAIDEHPVAPHEMRGLADGYNQVLRRRLGAAPADRVVAFQVVPLTSPRGAALGLSARF